MPLAKKLPEDPDFRNLDRSEIIGLCLALYRKLAYSKTGIFANEPDEAVVKDFLCDLGHFCDRSEGMDDETLFECWGTASMNYEAETNKTGKQFEVV